MSSHALDQERVWGIPVDVAIFTNLTQDHLDYHGTMGAYYSAKAKLFRGVGAAPPRVAVINGDDEVGKYLNGIATSSRSVVENYKLDALERGGHSFRAVQVEMTAEGISFLWRTPYGSAELRSPLTGRVNVYNLLAAAGAALARHMSFEEIVSATRDLKQVPGRFQLIPGSAEAGFTVVVDYAHTDDALRNLIALGRELVAEHGGRVITMFGCGGDRDKTKRPKMGRVAAEGSDLVVVTSDNPRSEDPMEIIGEVMVGVRAANGNAIIEADRWTAIRIAIHAARPGDIVLLAGKGHEKTQTFADRTVPFDDVAEATLALRELSLEKVK
jgi:UDP-N-acetylmuramoyl-L-alanyl-D-glutamate--2,6-diaminopimelate ligase